MLITNGLIKLIKLYEGNSALTEALLLGRYQP